MEEGFIEIEPSDYNSEAMSPSKNKLFTGFSLNENYVQRTGGLSLFVIEEKKEPIQKEQEKTEFVINIPSGFDGPESQIMNYQNQKEYEDEFLFEYILNCLSQCFNYGHDLEVLEDHIE